MMIPISTSLLADLIAAAKALCICGLDWIDHPSPEKRDKLHDAIVRLADILAEIDE